MRFSTTALVLGTLAAGQAVAASISHYQGKVHNHAERHADLMKAHHERRTIDHRDTSLISTADTQSILKLGVTSVGTNAVSSGSTAWIGSDGAFTNTFHNTASEDLVLVVWGVAGSWVNAVKPQITISIPQNGSKTVSFPSGWSGAWAPIYSGSSLTNGQVFDTWGEATFTPPYSVVDVSREVNMNGNSMSIVGPSCTTNMDTCVFTCKGSASTCLDQYQLVNCATGSQAGANFGTWNGADAGGCGGMGSGAQLNTYLG